jgi:allantoinase
MKEAIRSRRVFTPTEESAATVVFENGIISAVESYANAPEYSTDYGDLCILPGLVDAHVHINDPGRESWEGFATATEAAAAGGITCVVDMPLNSNPPTTTLSGLQQKRDAASGRCAVDYAFWGGVVPGNTHDISCLADAGVRGFKCFLSPSGVDEFSNVTEDDLRKAMPVIAETGLPLLVHAESPDYLRTSDPSLDPREYSTYLKSRPEEAELEAIRLLIRLCREFRGRIHIVHLATGRALPDLRSARAEGLPISVETCPHYLYFDAGSICDCATQYKCAPPIRSAATRDELWRALLNRDIDLVASDHSPCPPEMKQFGEGDFFKAWGGIASLSLSLPVVWTAARSRGVELRDVVRWMTEKPAELAGLSARKGAIAAGRDADFAILDSDCRFHVDPEDLYFRHKQSPYIGEELVGRVRKTFVRGACVFDEGRFRPECVGVECVV